MGNDVLRLIDDAESFCRIQDASGAPLKVPLAELSGQGALLAAKLTYKENDYVDATLQLRGVQARPMFACVAGIEGEHLRVRWMHFDPNDELKLKELLDRFRTNALRPEDKAETAAPPQPEPAPATTESAKQGTRRIVRPSNTVYTPFASRTASPGSGGHAVLPSGAKPPAPEAPSATNQAQVRQGTRRVIRPKADSEIPPASDAHTPTSAQQVLISDQSGGFPSQPTPSTPGDSSGNVAASSPAARFTQLQDVGANPAENPQSTETPGEAKVVIGADGKMDIGATIRSKAKTVRASDLAARHDKVRVLNMGTIKLLIQDAVGEAMQHINAHLGDAERKRLLTEAEAQFQERLKSFNAEKQGAEAYAKQLNDQLRRAQQLLEDERKREVQAGQFTVSEVGMGEIEDKMKRVLEHAMRTGNVSPELEQKLREMISHILDSERDRIRKQAEEAQSAQIDLLEKKIRRLAGNLEDAERQRDDAQALANALEQQGGGLRNVMSAGIADSDSNKKRKLALMKEILDLNRQMREELGVTYQRDDAAVAKVGEAASRLPNAPPPVVAAPAPEPMFEAAPADDADAPIVNPDDEVWEVKPIAVLSDEERDLAKVQNGGVKRMVVNASAPPPMFRKPGAA